MISRPRCRVHSGSIGSECDSSLFWSASQRRSPQKRGRRAGALAAPSWQIRTFAQGSGAKIETVPPSTFYILGDFSDSREWVSLDGGLSGSIRNPGPPFAADSVVSFSAIEGRQGVVTLDGRLLIGSRDGREWLQIAVPDTLGRPTAVFWLQAGTLLIGTRDGSLARIDLPADPPEWNRTARLGEAPVEKILSSGDDRLMVMLRDGGLFTQELRTLRAGDEGMRVAPDSSWIRAPFSASHFDVSRSGQGRAIARGSLDLHRTTDGGPPGTTRARRGPLLAPWARGPDWSSGPGE
jgi:hypothetical protein